VVSTVSAPVDTLNMERFVVVDGDVALLI